jgi:hypothetical protein
LDILTMHLPINVKSPNNISKWQIGFNSAFKGLSIYHRDETIMLFRNVGHKHPVTPRHIPDDGRSQLHRFERLKKSHWPHLPNFTCLVQTRGGFRFRHACPLHAAFRFSQSVFFVSCDRPTLHTHKQADTVIVSCMFILKFSTGSGKQIFLLSSLH